MTRAEVTPARGAEEGDFKTSRGPGKKSPATFGGFSQDQPPNHRRHRFHFMQSGVSVYVVIFHAYGELADVRVLRLQPEPARRRQRQ